MLMILLRLKKLRQTLKPVTLKSMIVSELLIIIDFLVNVTLKTGQDKYLLSILFWKLIPGRIKLKI